MRLLILGAGGHGRVCEEIAEESGYDEVAFLDDAEGVGIGKLENYQEKGKEYDATFVAFGDVDLRKRWIDNLKEVGYKVVSLVSSKAMVSKSAIVEEGSVIMAGAVVQTGAKIGKGGIVSAGAVVDHDVQVGDFCHINCNAVIPAMKIVPDRMKINYGQIFGEE